MRPSPCELLNPPSGSASASATMQWLATHDRITSGGYAAMTGTARSTPPGVLTGLVGDLLDRGVEARGRTAHFTLRRPVG